MRTLFPVVLGFLLDCALGDPAWLPHPVVAIGRLISFLERRLRGIFPKTPRGELAAGGMLAVLVPGISFASETMFRCKDPTNVDAACKKRIYDMGLSYPSGVVG